MSRNYFTIEKQLPSLNEYQNACRTNPHKGAKFKKEVEETVMWAILKAKTEGTLRKARRYPLRLKIEWHEKDRRRDVDNIKSAAKFILDAMTNSGLIEDDGRRYIAQIADEVIDDKRTYVVVEIYENEEQSNDGNHNDKQQRLDLL